MRYAVVWSETNGYPLIAVESHNQRIVDPFSRFSKCWWLSWYSLPRGDDRHLQNVYGFATKEEADNTLLGLQASVLFIGGFNDSTD